MVLRTRPCISVSAALSSAICLSFSEFWGSLTAVSRAEGKYTPTLVAWLGRAFCACRPEFSCLRVANSVFRWLSCYWSDFWASRKLRISLSFEESCSS